MNALLAYLQAHHVTCWEWDVSISKLSRGLEKPLGSTLLLLYLTVAIRIYSGQGCLGSSVVEYLPSAQGMIPGPGIESYIRFPAKSLLLPLPMSASLSLSVLMNKYINKIFKIHIYIYTQDSLPEHGRLAFSQLIHTHVRKPTKISRVA